MDMSDRGHIVSVTNRNTRGESIMDLFTSNLWIIMPSMWVLFIVYAVWYSTKAKNFAPLTHMEARQLWTIHTQGSHCEVKKWRPIKHNGQTVGFECGCGYKHVQQRPVIARGHSTTAPLAVTGFSSVQSSSQ